MPFTKSNLSIFATVVFKLLAIVLILFSVFTYAVSLLLGPILFYYTSDGLRIAGRVIREIPLSIFMAVPFSIPFPTDAGTLFGAIWLIFILCFFAAWFSRNGFVKSVKSLLKAPLLTAKTNYLLIMPLIATSLLYANVLIQRFQETQGVQTGTLTFPPATSQYIILLQLAFAPINEELAFRITSIGVPLGLFLLYRYRNDEKVTGIGNRIKLIVMTMLSPEHAKASLGYRTVSERGFTHGISLLEWLLILGTSLVFGLAHFLLGGGWEAGKVSTAFLAGLVFGVMYVGYGAYASILLHWFFDYYFTIMDLAETTYGGFLHPFSTIINLTNLVGGQIVLVILLLIWASRCGNYLSKRVVGLTEDPS